MNRGMYIAASSLLVNQRKLDAVSNNLSNINTTGYKKDIVVSESFNEMLLSKINDKPEVKNLSNFKGINVENDENSWTLSTDTGYFKVQTPTGDSYSRDLRFTIDEEGYLKTYYKNSKDVLKTDSENYVLGKNGKIRLDNSDLNIDKDGNVLSGGQTIDNLLIFPSPNVIGTISAGARVDKVLTNFSQGTTIESGNNLDFALDGDGFFKVYNGKENMYTRDGSFSLNESGELITSEGYFVLGQYGSILLEGNDFEINEKGEIIKNGEVIDKLDIVNIDNGEDLRKTGNNLYKIVDGTQASENQFDGQVLRGYLENSNVDTVKEMVEMISILRNYESSQKIINSYDDILGRAVNDIARL